MFEEKDIKKLEIEITFYLRGSARIRLWSMSNIIETISPSKKIYTNKDGFLITTGYVFGYNETGLTLPTYLPFSSYDDVDLIAYYNFPNDMERYDSLKRLYKCLNDFSQARIFQYDNTGHIVVEDDGKWVVY